jgi:hypothetical protein
LILKAATAPPPHFNSISLLSDKTVTLVLDGSVSNMFNMTGTISNQFMQMFDLYPVEASTNLQDWTRLAMLLRTNNDSEPLLFQDADAARLSHRFYRIVTNHLLTAFPRPSGPFSVGTMDRVMTDPARTNLYRYSPPTNAFMVTFWYPADPPPAGTLPAAMWSPRLAADLGLYSVGGFDTRWASIAPKLVGHSSRSVSLATGRGRFPVVLFSHGLPGSREFSSQIMEEVASHGYVVVAIDHTDCWAAQFPDGR